MWYKLIVNDGFFPEPVPRLSPIDDYAVPERLEPSELAEAVPDVEKPPPISRLSPCDLVREHAQQMSVWDAVQGIRQSPRFGQAVWYKTIEMGFRTSRGICTGKVVYLCKTQD